MNRNYSENRFVLLGRRFTSLFLAFALICMVFGAVQPVSAQAAQGETEMFGFSGQNWMASISGEKYLNEINIPGTHDTCCKSVWASHIYTSWYSEDAITQYLTLAEQLNAGIRLFDMRLTNSHGHITNSSADSLYLCHGAYRGASGAEILDFLYFCEDDDGYIISFENFMYDIENFLRANPSETVIINIKAEYDDTDKSGKNGRETLYKTAQKKLANYNFIYMEDRMPQLKEVRGKAVILTDDDHGYLGGGMSIHFSDPGSGTADLGGVTFYYENSWKENGKNKIDCVKNRYSTAYEETGENTLPQDTNTHLTTGRLVYTSASKSPTGDNPTEVAEVANPVLYNGLQPFFGTPEYFYGWVYSDFMTDYMSRLIWRSNFPAELDFCTITYTADEYPGEDWPILALRGTEITVKQRFYLEPEGMEFLGWQVGEDEENLLQPGEKMILEEDTTLRAVFKMTWYSLQRLISRAEAGDTLDITLPDDIVANENSYIMIVPRGATVNLNLNGHTLDRHLQGAGESKMAPVLFVHGTLNVTGPGLITGGNDDYGAGIRVSPVGHLSLTDVTITGNTAKGRGAGIYITGVGSEGPSTLTIAGKTIITGNTLADGTENNVYIVSSKYMPCVITVGDHLSEESQIGVTTDEKPKEDVSILFLNGLVDEAALSSFVSDEGYYLVPDGNEAYVSLTPAPEPVEPLPTYRVEFEVKGGNPMEPLEIEEGSCIPEPETPERTGASFGGWYTNRWLDGDPFDFETPVFENTTLYAKWLPVAKKLTVNITYQVEDSTGGADEKVFPAIVDMQTYQVDSYHTQDRNYNDYTSEDINLVNGQTQSIDLFYWTEDWYGMPRLLYQTLKILIYDSTDLRPRSFEYDYILEGSILEGEFSETGYSPITWDAKGDITIDPFGGELRYQEPDHYDADGSWIYAGSAFYQNEWQGDAPIPEEVNLLCTLTRKTSENWCTVTFLDSDDTVLLQKRYPYGTSGSEIEIPEMPAKPIDAQYENSFIGWSRRVIDVWTDLTFKAAYRKTVRKYPVTFVTEDGQTILQESSLAYGTKADQITVPAAHMKEQTAEFFYTFEGWSPEIVDVSGPAVYTAVYHAEPVPEPEVSETEVPETEVPETEVPETEVLETEVSETEVSETEAVVEPETEVPETEVPETEVLETEAPETEVSEPETVVEPETEVPETEVPETEVSETEAVVELETEVPETETPETEVSETETVVEPEMEVPETEAPETEATEAPEELELPEEVGSFGGAEETAPAEETPEASEDPSETASVFGGMGQGGLLVVVALLAAALGFGAGYLFGKRKV